MTLVCRQVGYHSGVDRLYLRVPVEISHVISDDSPIAAWRHAGGVAEQDSFSEIIVVVRASSVCLDAWACQCPRLSM